MKYIKESIDKQENGCILCTKPGQADDRANLILHRGKTAYVICNKFPYNNGHLMVVPYAHTGSLDDVGDECSLELWKLIALCRRSSPMHFRPTGSTSASTSAAWPAPA